MRSWEGRFEKTIDRVEHRTVGHVPFITIQLLEWSSHKGNCHDIPNSSKLRVASPARPPHPPVTQQKTSPISEAHNERSCQLLLTRTRLSNYNFWTEERKGGTCHSSLLPSDRYLVITKGQGLRLPMTDVKLKVYGNRPNYLEGVVYISELNTLVHRPIHQSSYRGIDLHLAKSSLHTLHVMEPACTFRQQIAKQTIAQVHRSSNSENPLLV